MIDENKKYILYGCIGIGVLTLAAILLCWNVSDNRTGINAVGNQLRSVENNQQEITDGIDTSEKRAGDIKDRIDRSQEANNVAANRADKIEDNITDAESIITECKRILGDIRSRGETKK